jgi:peptide/nickel transport system permease protein
MSDGTTLTGEPILSDDAFDAELSESRRSPWVLTLHQALKQHRTQIGLVLVVLLVLIAVFGPFVSPYSATESIGPPFSQPSHNAVFGTDYVGRDVLSRFLHGGRSIFVLALSATILGVTLGTLIGLAAAYSRPRVDELLMRISDILMAFPPIILALLVISTIGPKAWLLVLTIGIAHAPRVARLVRGSSLEVVHRDYVKAAEALGETRTRILFGEILPNITSPLLVEASLRLTYSIILVASLSFLGFGIQPPAADWGLMVNENRAGLTVQPWAVILPIAAIGLLTIGTNLIADGLSRALIGIDRSSVATEG